MVRKRNKKLYFQFTSFINLTGVFHTHSRVSSNLTVTIICFVLRFSLQDAQPRTCNYQFCEIIQFQIKKDHYSKSLLISNTENIQFVINLCLLCFSTKTLVTLLKIACKIILALKIINSCYQLLKHLKLLLKIKC